MPVQPHIALVTTPPTLGTEVVSAPHATLSPDPMESEAISRVDAVQVNPGSEPHTHFPVSVATTIIITPAEPTVSPATQRLTTPPAIYVTGPKAILLSTQLLRIPYNVYSAQRFQIPTEALQQGAFAQMVLGIP